MRIVGLSLFELEIPFVEGFAHSAKTRAFSDSIVVKARAEDGGVGYGEGVARPYVTGESVDACVAHIRDRLWPAIADQELDPIRPGPDPLTVLAPFGNRLPDTESPGVIAWHAARTAVELALIDCALRQQHLSLGAILPPKRKAVTYSGVISASTPEKAAQQARHFKLFGIRQIKIKIGEGEDQARIAAVRAVLGSDASLRVDANGAYDPKMACDVLNALAAFDIACVEQPIPRGNPADLRALRKAIAIPVMVDESFVTLTDAEALIACQACDYFNLRLSKCGGLHRTLQAARLARQAGVRLQLGCQVGETAILSAAGRHVAAYLDEVDFVEGSYGNLLLQTDIAKDNIHFGHGGRAPVLHGPGLGIQVRDDLLETFARRITRLGSV